jgi:hypothetical protein
VTRSPLTQWAGEYLKRGLAVIALSGKTPNTRLHKRGLYDALRGAPDSEADLDFIASFFDADDTTGVGILTGEPYVVVDIDGPIGMDEWVEIAAGDYRPDRWVAMTRHGLHIWYSPSLDLLKPVDDGLVGPGTTKLGTRLDLKGFGGYVAAPPSKFDDTEACDRYHQPCETYTGLLPPGDEPPLEAPDGLISRIRRHQATLSMRIEAKDLRERRWGPRWKPGDHVYYAQRGHDSLIKGMAEAKEGNRNSFLHWAAATLAEEGGVEEDFEQLHSAAIANGLTAEESTRTIRSARRAHG